MTLKTFKKTKNKIMKNLSSTEENLRAIYDAMRVIEDNERSELFKDYYWEVIGMLLKEMKLNDPINFAKSVTNTKILI